jgi:glycosyltransferase involved in cell wall biosynthesis
MRFLFVVSNLRGGGAERAILNFAAGLAERGHDCQMVIFEQAVDYPVPPGVQLHVLHGGRRGLPGGWIGKRLLARSLRSLHRRLTGEMAFDLTISTLPFADEVVHAARLPRVRYRIANNLSAEIDAIGSRFKARRRTRRYRRLYEGQRLIAVSQGVAEDLQANMGLQHARVATIYNPFDFHAIRGAAREVPPDLPSEPYFLHVGRFQPQKRHDLLLDAFARAGLPHRLVLLTEPSRELDKLIESRGLVKRVTVAGFRENPFPWYANAAACVLSSDREGMPNVLIESLVCGTPAVSTDCPSGPQEVLQDELSQWLVPRGDAVALAAKMREVIKAPPKIDPALLERFSKAHALNAIEALAREA